MFRYECASDLKSNSIVGISRSAWKERRICIFQAYRFSILLLVINTESIICVLKFMASPKT